MSIAFFVGKFIIVFCICMATGKLIEGGVHDLWLSKQYANIIVDIYELCTSVIDRMIEAIMRCEARIIGVTKGDFSE